LAAKEFFITFLYNFPITALNTCIIVPVLRTSTSSCEWKDFEKKLWWSTENSSYEFGNLTIRRSSGAHIKFEL
jgi:hypothetical protein